MRNVVIDKSFLEKSRRIRVGDPRRVLDTLDEEQPVTQGAKVRAKKNRLFKQWSEHVVHGLSKEGIAGAELRKCGSATQRRRDSVCQWCGEESSKERRRVGERENKKGVAVRADDSNSTSSRFPPTQKKQKH